MSIDTLLAERRPIEARQRRRKKQAEADRARLFEISQQLEKLKLNELVGVQGGVKLGTRYEADHPNAKFNSARGTLVKVNRTLALVDFGELGRWKWPIEDLVAAESRQAVTLAAMLAGDMGDV